jgi:hypothetical protein
MAKHLVKCKYCNKTFDANIEPYVLVSNGRRYAHEACAKQYETNKTQEQKDLEDLQQYITKLFKNDYDYARVQKQLKEYKEKYNYTYSGVLKTLIYWYEVKGNDISKANRAVGIVPYVYDQALQYYYNLFLAEMINADKDIQSYQMQVRQVEIPPPRPYKSRIKLFHFLDDEGGDNNG